MNLGYVSLQAIEKAKEHLNREKPEGYEKGLPILQLEPWQDVIDPRDENACIPPFVVRWSTESGDAFKAYFSYAGEFLMLIPVKKA